MQKRTSSYLEVNGNGLQDIVSGFAWLIKLAQTDLSKRSALLAIPLLKMLEVDIAPILGRQAVAGLASGNEYRIETLLTLTVMTERKPRRETWPGPILAVYPTRKLLDIIDGMSEVTDLLVVTRKVWAIQYWINTWRVAPLGASPLPPARQGVSRVLAAALKTLTLRCKTSTEPAGPFDRAAVVSLFETLRRRGFAFDPVEVRAWLVAEGGWKPVEADEVREIAAGVLAGKRFRIDRYEWSDHILEAWQAEARREALGPNERFGQR